MKREELVRYDGEWYDANIVDCLLDEKDAEIASLKAENDRLKAKLETVNELVKTSKDMYDHTIESLKASHYAEMVDAGMRERRLKRAFYKACANWAHIAVAFFSSYATKEKWHKMERKCLNKMEEYK